jgi:hypothetical protein
MALREISLSLSFSLFFLSFFHFFHPLHAWTIDEIIFDRNDSYVCHKRTFIDVLESVLLTHPIQLKLTNFFSYNRFITFHPNVFYAYEHSLVLRKGIFPDFNTADYPGKVPTLTNNDTYWVYIHSYEESLNADIVVEYSLANIENLRLGGVDISRYVYAPCLPFLTYFHQQKLRFKKVITSFHHMQNDIFGRRRKFLNGCKNRGLLIENLHFNSYTEEKLLLENSQIMVNIHQSPYHHTLEELRILPAMQLGVVVVSEWVPLSEVIPFSPYIIFCKYEELIDTVVEVTQNYDVYFDKFYGHNSKLPQIFNQMRKNLHFSLIKRLDLLTHKN